METSMLMLQSTRCLSQVGRPIPYKARMTQKKGKSTQEVSKI